MRQSRQVQRLACAAAPVVLALLAAPRAARGDVGAYINDGSIDNAVYLNNFDGASALYSGSYNLQFPALDAYLPVTANDYGSGATLAVIDLGLIDNSSSIPYAAGTTRVDTYFSSEFASPQSTAPSDLIGEHATIVGTFAAGYNPSATSTFNAEVAMGIAPAATLWSGSVIDSGNPNGSNYDISNSSFITPFIQTMQTGYNGAKADVVNVSLGGVDPTGDDFYAIALDALVAANHTTMVIAAGNNGPGADTVETPGTSFNGITVGALGSSASLSYNSLSSYSSRGPNDFYNPVTGVTTPGVRPAVDIVAPGDYLVTDSLGNNEYGYGAGTSFATPQVAGAAALLSAAAHSLQSSPIPVVADAAVDANDSRVIKAILMNSADKLPGWNNGQTMIDGVLTTTQGLDYTTGAGRLNIARAADNYLNGAFDPKVVGQSAYIVGPKGWDLSTVTTSQPNIYNLGVMQAGSPLTATLDWNVDRALDETDLSTTDDRFVDLNLEVLEIETGVPTLIAESDASYNNVQQLSFDLSTTADYELEVSWGGMVYGTQNPSGDSEEYGLAWSNVSVVPEPTSLALALPALLLLRRRRPA